MDLRTAVSAFAHRGARRGTAATFLVYSALLTVAMLLLAAWIAPDARASDVAMLQWAVGTAPQTLDPSLWTTLALADVLAVWALGLGGFVIAPAVVAAAVAHERRAGTLDQLRTTPLSPLGVACGFVVGVPARLYLLCAGPLLLHVTAGVVGPVPLSALVQSLAVLGVGTAAACVLALVVALAPRQETGGAFVALGVAAASFAAAMMTAAFAGDRHLAAWAWLHPAGALDAAMLLPHGLWRRLVVGPWGGNFDEAGYVGTLSFVPLVAVAAGLAFGALLLRAACRKLATPSRPLFGKAQAVALFALTALALVVPLAAADRADGLDLDGIYAFSVLLSPVLVALGVFATPTFEAWAMAVRRGGATRWSADEAAPHRAVWLMLAGWTALAFVLAGRHTLHALGGDETLALGWTALVAVTLPVYFLFAATRYAGLAARVAFGVAVAVHLVAQTVAIALVRGHDLHGMGGTFATLAAIAAVAVPAWIGWRQHVLRRSLAR